MARGFVFELEPLLEHRRRIEEEHQRAVAALERTRLAIEERIRAAQDSITEAREVLRDQLSGAAGYDSERGSADSATPTATSAPGRVALDGVRLQMNASLHITARARQAVLELAGAHKRLEAARGQLLEATRARRALEMLKERRFERWKREQRRREEREMDEINTQRASRADATDLETPR